MRASVWLVGLVFVLTMGRITAQDPALREALTPGRPAPTLLKWSSSSDDGAEDAPRDEPLVTDRPDFTESSTTVGRGRLQIELGYTFAHDRADGARVDEHSYPELLCRFGLLRDWLELRVGWSHATVDESGAPSLTGALDLYVGAKLALTPQDGILPEMALLPQAFVPTGHDAFTGRELLPGLNWLYSWDINDWLAIAGSSQANRTLDDSGHHHVAFAQSLTAGYGVFERAGFFTEWFAFFPAGSTDPSAGPKHFFNGGVALLITDNLQLDARAGVGLNARAEDFFAGSGLSVRF